MCVIPLYPFVQLKFPVYGHTQTYKHTHATRNAITLVWGSLRLAPINHDYRNSLFVRCKNIFGRRKRTKIFYTNIILPNENFLRVGWLLAAHQHFPNCCCPYILVYVVASNTTSNLLFTSHLFCMLCDLLN